MEFEIKQLKPKDEKRWGDFVIENDQTTFYHQIGWKNVVQKTYDHKPFYLFAEDEVGNITGIFPLFYMNNLFFGRRLVSIPFSPYGGVCAVDDHVERALMDEAIDIGDDLGVDYCEFRNFKTNCHGNISCTRNFSTFVLDVSAGHENVWNKMNRNVRNRIRKGIKSNLKYEMDASLEGISKFYELYSWSMKRLGTPVHDQEFFRNILKQFPDNVFTSRASLDGLPIASFYLLTFKDVLTTAWGAALSEFFQYAPNDFMYWNCVEYASKNNLSWVDFGRSLVNSGNQIFKTRWGCTEFSLNYSYYPPSMILRPPHDEYRKYAKVWSRLPLSLTAKIGPNIRRDIP